MRKSNVEAVGTVYQTSNYEMFELNIMNRDISNTKRLESSMAKYGFWQTKPIHVDRVGKKLVIKDGHHRFEIAKKLEIPVCYMISENPEITLREISGSENIHTMANYLQENVRAGNPNYIAVKRFHEKTGISLNNCISILANESAAGCNHANRFKDGVFVVKADTYADKIAELVEAMKSKGIAFAACTNLVKALSRIIIAGHADLKLLKHKMATFPFLIERRSTLDQYSDMFEDLYNYRQGNKVALSYLTISPL